jgi:hypothetical protein
MGIFDRRNAAAIKRDLSKQLVLPMLGLMLGAVMSGGAARAHLSLLAKTT